MRIIFLPLLFYSLSSYAVEFESLIASIEVKDEIKGDDYDRKKHFGDWIDEDGDQQDTRHEVLAQESLIPVTWSSDGKKVISGLWYDPFTGRNFSRPSRLDSHYAILQIDHVVPLKEAWQSGAKNWPQETRVAFANDLTNHGHLIAIRGGTNGSKGYKDPAEWLPPNEQFECAYVITWSAIKAEWGLSMDRAEKEAILDVMSRCTFEY